MIDERGEQLRSALRLRLGDHSRRVIDGIGNSGNRWPSSSPVESANALEHRRMRVVQRDVQRVRRQVGEAVGREAPERAGEGSPRPVVRGERVGLALVARDQACAPSDSAQLERRQKTSAKHDQPGVHRRRSIAEGREQRRLAAARATSRKNSDADLDDGGTMPLQTCRRL